MVVVVVIVWWGKQGEKRGEGQTVTGEAVCDLDEGGVCGPAVNDTPLKLVLTRTVARCGVRGRYRAGMGNKTKN